MPFNRMYRNSRGRNRSRNFNPIQSVKNQRNENISYLGGNVNNTYNVAVGVAVGTTTTTVNVPVGCKIYGVVVSMNFVNGTANNGTTYSWMILKLRQEQTLGGSFSGASSEWSVIGTSNARNQIIESFMGVTGTEDAMALRTTHYVKIPKIYQRMREGDRILIVWNSSESGSLSIGSRYKYYQ